MSSCKSTVKIRQMRYYFDLSRLPNLLNIFHAISKISR
jgi:hypothetical protein